ncbi:MAG: hypothetical protein FJ125_17375 [Deltaproteobacteria bacterium]|nr:hypothetical protein [Deltaproteobacteria bacterium]
MRPPKLERQELLRRVAEAVATGRYRILPHARLRCTEREVSAPDIEHALERGTRSPGVAATTRGLPPGAIASRGRPWTGSGCGSW